MFLFGMFVGFMASMSIVLVVAIIFEISRRRKAKIKHMTSRRGGLIGGAIG